MRGRRANPRTHVLTPWATFFSISPGPPTASCWQRSGAAREMCAREDTGRGYTHSLSPEASCHCVGVREQAGRWLSQKPQSGRNSTMSVSPSSPGRWPLSLCWDGELPAPEEAADPRWLTRARQAAGCREGGQLGFEC